MESRGEESLAKALGDTTVLVTGASEGSERPSPNGLRRWG
ncbi:hypothetical protein CM49_00612 [Paenibacillus sp. P1XP2]|nr:hypothetical protein CM49_00612 [Paenibacillus sp. P1XP2]